MNEDAKSSIRRILLADGEDRILRAFSKQLARRGFLVCHPYDVADAARLLARRPSFSQDQRLNEVAQAVCALLEERITA